MSSSEVVNILHYLTFWDFSDFFVGDAERRPLVFRFIFPFARPAKAGLAARQKEVRNFLRLVFALLVKRIFGIM